MTYLMEQTGVNFFGAGEKLAWRQGDAIGGWAVERLRSCVLNVRRVGHPGDDPLGGVNRIVLLSLDLWQLVEDCLWKLALLKIEQSIVSQDETPAGLVVGVVLLGIGLAFRVSNLIDLPKYYDLAVLAFASIHQARLLASW